MQTARWRKIEPTNVKIEIGFGKLLFYRLVFVERSDELHVIHRLEQVADAVDFEGFDHVFVVGRGENDGRSEWRKFKNLEA